MIPSVPGLTDEMWYSLCRTSPVRPAMVAIGRARLEADDWPPPLAVADAVLGTSMGPLLSRC